MVRLSLFTAILGLAVVSSALPTQQGAQANGNPAADEGAMDPASNFPSPASKVCTDFDPRENRPLTVQIPTGAIDKSSKGSKPNESTPSATPSSKSSNPLSALGGLSSVLGLLNGLPLRSK